MRYGLTILLLFGCGRTRLVSPPADTGSIADVADVDAPPVDVEGRLYVAQRDGELHVVRVELDGAITTWGPPLSEAVPPVATVGRMLQSTDARRVLVQDHSTGKTHALRGSWADTCPSVGAERCYPGSRNPDLSTFIMHGSSEDAPARPTALVSYSGAMLAASDGRLSVHSIDGWSVLRDDDGWFSWSAGMRAPLAFEEDELVLLAFRRRFITWHRDSPRLWLRDHPSGDREAILCPDRTQPVLSYPAFACCGDELYSATDDGFVPTGHSAPPDCASDPVVHVEHGSFTITTSGGWTFDTASVSVWSPTGERIATESRTYEDPPEPRDTYPLVYIYGAKPTSDEWMGYIFFAHMGVAHDDFVIQSDEGILRWTPSSTQWVPIATSIEPRDAATFPVWFPQDARRAFWVTRDGRLLGFALEEGLVDYSSGWEFVPNVAH